VSNHWLSCITRAACLRCSSLSGRSKQYRSWSREAARPSSRSSAAVNIRITRHYITTRGQSIVWQKAASLPHMDGIRYRPCAASMRRFVKLYNSLYFTKGPLQNCRFPW